VIRILSFILIVFLIGLGFAWLADRPGDLVLTWGGMRYEVSLIVAAGALVALIALIMIAWWLVMTLIRSPARLRRHLRTRRRERGYQSLSTGLIAAGAGDAYRAREMSRQARKLLNVEAEPLLKLLEAQAAMLEGKAEEARTRFERMLEYPETKLLGLRGLFLEAHRAGAREAAFHYAEKAAAVAPQLEWAANSTLARKTAEGDWDGALKLLDGLTVSNRIDRDTARRDRAALLTAKAIGTIDTDPVSARNAALEAHRLQPQLVPAAVTAAQVLYRQGDLRRGSRVLESVWKLAPHPEVAEAYVHARPGDSVQDRLKRARHLASLKPGDPEASLALARAELDAGDFKEARRLAAATLRSAPRESVYLLLADIEEAETGDQGRVRQWLAKALKAPRDPAWTADGIVSEHWLPASPVTGRLNAFEWKVPVEQLAPVIDAEEDERVVMAQEKPVSAAPAIEQEGVIEAEGVSSLQELAAASRAETVPATDAGEKSAEDMASDESRPAVQPVSDSAAIVPQTEGHAVEREDPPAAQSPRPPDDPGVEEEEAPGKTDKRFRLF